jgi:hypothetical protein
VPCDLPRLVAGQAVQAVFVTREAPVDHLVGFRIMDGPDQLGGDVQILYRAGEAALHRLAVGVMRDLEGQKVLLGKQDVADIAILADGVEEATLCLAGCLMSVESARRAKITHTFKFT